MRNTNLIILTLVVLGLGGFIFFLERHQPTTDERVQRQGKVFPDLDSEIIESLEVVTSSGPLRLALVDGEWRLLEPVDYPADAMVVRALIQSVAELEAERTLALGEVELADYGLDMPSLSVKMIASDGRRFVLAVGEETPLGSRRALRRDEDEEIVLSPGAFVANLDKELDQWRSRDVVDVLEHELASVEISTDDDRIHAVRVDDRWRLLQPLVDLADAEQMRSLISELGALRVGEFLPADADVSELGLDSPAFRVTLARTDGEEGVTLELSAEEGEAGSGFVNCRRNGVDLFRVPTSIVTRLSKAPVLWRSDKVWPFSSWDVTNIEISVADDTRDLARVDNDDFGKIWRFADGVEADNIEVSRRLGALADLEVREHDLLLPPTEVLGSVVLALDEDPGVEGLTFTFYAPIEDGGHAAVTVSSRDNVMGVDAATVGTIVGDLEKLRPVVAETPVE